MEASRAPRGPASHDPVRTFAKPPCHPALRGAKPADCTAIHFAAPRCNNFHDGNSQFFSLVKSTSTSIGATVH
jgi:hypothetical protein